MTAIEQAYEVLQDKVADTEHLQQLLDDVLTQGKEEQWLEIREHVPWVREAIEAQSQRERFAHQLKVRTEERERAYSERNVVAATLARMAIRAGYRAGWRHDSEQPLGWQTVIMVDLPTGQVSWHIPDSETSIVEGMPRYPDKWDGHSTEEKYDRCRKLGMLMEERRG